jgi:uncharacterized protein YneR
MVMKNSIKRTMLIITSLLCVSAWAFDPDTDSSLKFLLNFQNNSDDTHTTDAKASITGVLNDYNSLDLYVFKPNGIRSVYADFNQPNDAGQGPAIDDTTEPNDCYLSFMPVADIFEFGTGFPGGDQTTIAFWFNMPNVDSGSFIRHESSYEDPETYYWEIRAISGKMEFRRGNNALRFESADTLGMLGVQNNTWHHVALVIDRTNCVMTTNPTMSQTTKMYLDGAEIPIYITSLSSSTTELNIDSWPNYVSPLMIGSGSRNFDGLMDDVRLYGRALDAMEVSLLYQSNTYAPHVTAIKPIPKLINVPLTTGISWGAYSGASSEKLYFGESSTSLAQVTLTDANKASNTQLVTALGKSLELGKTYYWYVKSRVGSTDIDSPMYSFTAETGKATNPSPSDEEEDVEVSDVNLSWTGSPSAVSYDVYYSTQRNLVESLSSTVLRANDNTTCIVEDVNTKFRGMDYYWCVVSNFSGGATKVGDIWTFRSRPYELVFNTRKNHVSRYQGYDIPPLTCSLHSDGWADVITGSLDADANIAVFTFPSGFNYDRHYDITVVPIYRAEDINSTINVRPVSIRVTGDFYFDGRIRIAGEDVLTSQNDTPQACSGGYPGPRHNSSSTSNLPDNLCWTQTATSTAGFHTRFGTADAKSFWMPNARGKNVFGPGISRAISPYKTGGGGGYGGQGGNCGRGYMHGIDCSGPTYGDKEIPIPFGGSAGGWGSVAAGAGGGGGIEIIATGNVTFDANSEIRANGGNSSYSAVGSSSGTGSGGSGGAVKIIAGGNFVNKGTINVRGGKGGDSSTQGNNAGGGGGGGRIAIYYGGTYTNTGLILAEGGEKGIYAGSAGKLSLGEDGQKGTIYIVKSSVVSPKKASAPTPVNGDPKCCIGLADPNTNFKLKWYSGYGATNDKVWIGTSIAAMAPTGATIPATRTQHSITYSVQNNKTYYWQVKSDSNSIASDIWTFTTVNWLCPLNAIANNHFSGPEWDNNGDCVVNDADFWYFAKDWRIQRVTGTQDYTLDYTDMINSVPTQNGGEMLRFANEWLECINRTNSGCNGW